MPSRPSSPMALTASSGKRAVRSHWAAKGARRSAAKLRAISRIIACCSVSAMELVPSPAPPGGARRPSSSPSPARSPGPALARPPARRDLDLDPHTRVDEAGDDGGRGGTDVAEILLEERLDLRPVLGPRHDIPDAHHVGQARAGLTQRRKDVPERLMHLLSKVRGNAHGRVIEAGAAGDEHPFALHDRAGIGSGPLELGAGGDQPPRHGSGLLQPARPTQQLAAAVRADMAHYIGACAAPGAFIAADVSLRRLRRQGLAASLAGCAHFEGHVRYPLSWKSSRPISMRRISLVPAPIS